MTETKGEPEQAVASEATQGAESDPPLTEEDLEAVDKVKNRLKFFFSDANIRQDHFLRKLLMNDKGDSPNKVPIEALLRFNTIKMYTKKAAVIVKATKELSGILTLDNDENAIGRVVPFTEDLMDANIPKSLHIQNLPLTSSEDGKGSKQYATSIEQIRDLFSKYGEVALVKLKWSAHPESKEDRKNSGNRKKFPVGAALVEFETEESMSKAADAALTLKDGEKVTPKEKLVLAGREIEVMTLVEFINKRKKHKESTKLDTENESKNENSDKRSHDEITDDTPEFTFDWEPGCVIRLEGLPTACDREALLDMISAALNISVDKVKEQKIYADYSRGQTDGAIRFPKHSDDIAAVAKRLKEGELTINGEKLKSAFVLEGEEEKKYWDNFVAFKNKQILQNKEEKRAKKMRSGRGGRKL